MSDSKWEQVGQFVGEQMARHEIPGVALGMYHDGEVYSAGFGVTSVENPLPVTADTLFQIGSITKTYTATTIMQLVEAGELSLDDRVRHYIPDFALEDETAAERVTIRHLLNHTGGWDGDLFVDTGLGSDSYALYIQQMRDLPQLVPFGTHFTYNNTGFAVMAAIVEKVRGQPIEDVMHAGIFEPLRMARTFVHPMDAMSYRTAEGHIKADTLQHMNRIRRTSRSSFAIGSIFSTADDQLQYACAYLNGGSLGAGRILTGDSVEQIMTPEAPLNHAQAWGIGWALTKLGEERVVWHGGGTPGHINDLQFLPERQFALVILTNAGHSYPGFIKAIRRFVFKTYLNIDIPQPEPVHSDIEARRAVTGIFARQLVRLDIDLVGDKLVCVYTSFLRLAEQEAEERVLPPFRLAFCDDDMLVVLDGIYQGETMDIIRADDGAIMALRFRWRIFRRQG